MSWRPQWESFKQKNNDRKNDSDSKEERIATSDQIDPKEKQAETTKTNKQETHSLNCHKETQTEQEEDKETEISAGNDQQETERDTKNTKRHKMTQRNLILQKNKNMPKTPKNSQNGGKQAQNSQKCSKKMQKSQKIRKRSKTARLQPLSVMWMWAEPVGRSVTCDEGLNVFTWASWDRPLRAPRSGRRPLFGPFGGCFVIVRLLILDDAFWLFLVICVFFCAVLYLFAVFWLFLVLFLWFCGPFMAVSFYFVAVCLIIVCVFVMLVSACGDVLLFYLLLFCVCCYCFVSLWSFLCFWSLCIFFGQILRL